jgi:cytochrome c oxidase subunit 1
MTGRMMDEKLGKAHFWLNFIAMNLTFFPMHFSGLYGMPRRIYTYDAGQGWEGFNLTSSIGTIFLIVGMLIFVYNFFFAGRRGPIAGNDPWGGSTLEWSIPSPPPEYNFARIPHVTSRNPLWDIKAPAQQAADAGMHIEHATGKSAKELGIPMPNRTIKPLFCALGLTIMFSGLLFIHKDKLPLALAVIFGGALLMVFSLYAWVLTPLEDAH